MVDLSTYTWNCTSKESYVNHQTYPIEPPINPIIASWLSHHSLLNCYVAKPLISIVQLQWIQTRWCFSRSQSAYNLHPLVSYWVFHCSPTSRDSSAHWGTTLHESPIYRLSYEIMLHLSWILRSNVRLWLVVDLPLWKKSGSWDDYSIPNIWENKKCSKAPTRFVDCFNHMNSAGISHSESLWDSTASVEKSGDAGCLNLDVQNG